MSASRAMSDNHVRVWTAERVVAAINIPAVVVPFMYTNPITDAIFCTVFVLHGHWGKTSAHRQARNLRAA